MLGVIFLGDQHSGVTQIPTCAFIKYHDPGLKVERSKFVTWPVFLCCVLRKDMVLSQWVFLFPLKV